MIYFAERIDTAIKIGWTKRDPRDRMVGLGLVSDGIVLRGVLPGEFKEEQAIHKRLTAYRWDHQREWYKPTHEVMAEVARSVPYDLDPITRPEWQFVVPKPKRESPQLLPGDELFSEEQMRMIVLDQAMAHGGSMKDMARKFNVNAQGFAGVNSGRQPPSKAIIDALGYERVVTYRRKAK